MRQAKLGHQRGEHLGLGLVAEIVQLGEALGIARRRSKAAGVPGQVIPNRRGTVVQRAVQVKENAANRHQTPGLMVSSGIWASRGASKTKRSVLASVWG